MGAGWAGAPACGWGAGAAVVVVGEPRAACFAPPALALAVALRMTAGGMGEEEGEEDEEDVVLLGDGGRAAMRAGAALQAAAASAAATAGRMEGIPSGCGFGAGGCRGPVPT